MASLLMLRPSFHCNNTDKRHAYNSARRDSRDSRPRGHYSVEGTDASISTAAMPPATELRQLRHHRRSNNHLKPSYQQHTRAVRLTSKYLATMTARGEVAFAPIIAHKCKSDPPHVGCHWRQRCAIPAHHRNHYCSTVNNACKTAHGTVRDHRFPLPAQRDNNSTSSEG